MTEMTSRERLLTAYRNQQPDRVPIRIWGVEPGMKPIHPSFQPLCDASAETDIVRGWSPKAPGIFGSASDKVSSRTETRPSEVEDYQESVTIITTPEGDLTSIHYSSLTPGKPGYTKKYMIESMEDVKKYLSVPYVPLEVDCSTFKEADRAIGDSGVLMCPLGPEPMYHINALIGSELFAIWSIEERDTLRELIETTFVRTRDFLKCQLAAGVGPLFGYVGPELSIPPLQSPRDFNEFVVQYDRQLIDLIHDNDGIAWVHCHGRMGPVLESFVEMGCDCLNPVEPPPMGDVTLAEAKARVGDKMALEGNIQQGDLYRSTPEEMEELVKTAIREGAPNGGFILCPTSSPWQEPTLDDKTLQNYLRFIEAGRKYGKYPISA